MPKHLHRPCTMHCSSCPGSRLPAAYNDDKQRFDLILQLSLIPAKKKIKIIYLIFNININKGHATPPSDSVIGARFCCRVASYAFFDFSYFIYGDARSRLGNTPRADIFKSKTINYLKKKISSDKTEDNMLTFLPPNVISSRGDICALMPHSRNNALVIMFKL